MRYVTYIVAGTAIALTACAVGPDYHAPALDLPPQWHASQITPAETSEAMLPAEPWWMSFDDDKLDDLIKRALANNHDRKVAEARILEARASRQSTASVLYPQLQGAGQISRGNLGYQTFDKDINLYQPEFDASYEIDLFGGNRRRVEAQDATIAAREADFRDVTLTLIAEVARGYMDWRQLQQQLQLSRDTVSAQQQLFDITQAQSRAGTASSLEVSQAETLYKSTVARLPDIERQLEASGYALSVLLGETPGHLNDELQAVKPLPVPLSLSALNAPADVLRRRPDVQRAERELAAATAMQGAAISEMYPKITLSALFGIQDTNLNPSTTVWSLLTAARPKQHLS
jgi:NodT family efflux transporter outer membrane factor (OMF) lipoprotein